MCHNREHFSLKMVHICAWEESPKVNADTKIQVYAVHIRLPRNTYGRVGTQARKRKVA